MSFWETCSYQYWRIVSAESSGLFPSGKYDRDGMLNRAARDGGVMAIHTRPGKYNREAFNRAGAQLPFLRRSSRPTRFSVVRTENVAGRSDSAAKAFVGAGDVSRLTRSR